MSNAKFNIRQRRLMHAAMKSPENFEWHRSKATNPIHNMSSFAVIHPYCTNAIRNYLTRCNFDYTFYWLLFDTPTESEGMVWPVVVECKQSILRHNEFKSPRIEIKCRYYTNCIVYLVKITKLFGLICNNQLCEVVVFLLLEGIRFRRSWCLNCSDSCDV